MRAEARLWVRRWGWRLHLIAYCERCDGSVVESLERARDRMAAAGIISTRGAPVSGVMPHMFRPDRWRWHTRHERARNDADGSSPLFPEGRRRVTRADRLAAR